MYFKSRSEAGRKLAAKLKSYKDQNVFILALSDGGVEVGEEIARSLNCPLTILLTSDINLPGENSVLGTIDQTGGFTYNSMFSVGQLEEYLQEFHNYLEAEKLVKLSNLNKVLGQYGEIERHNFSNKIVILVTDGAINGASFDVAYNYLKPIRLDRLIAATPIVSIDAVDRMHIIMDEIVVLGVTENYLETNHYYENNAKLSTQGLMAKLSDLRSLNRVAENNGRKYT
ncbi:MAG TPA: hypothetical protein VGA08_01565 [Candidatus Saccharimonadales bacterium]